MSRSHAAISVCFTLLMTFGAITKVSSDTKLTPIRIGWQTTWATQGQIAQTLSHTNVLSKNGLQATFVGVSYGAPLNEAALAGDVDVIFTADQPAAALLARSDDWVIIGRLMFNRVAIYVPADSPVKTVADLKGKTIPMPFGAAAQRVAFKAIADAGLDPRADIDAVNLDITEQAGIVQRGTSASWGEVDAMAGFDPMVAILEVNKSARMLHIGKVTSVIVMSRTYISAYPGAPERFLRAFVEAVFYFARHIEQANEWFLKASQLNFGHDVLALAASVEPNLLATSVRDIRISLTPQVVEGLQEAADFLYDQSLIGRQLEIAEHIDQQYSTSVEAHFDTGEYLLESVHVVEPQP